MTTRSLFIIIRLYFWRSYDALLGIAVANFSWLGVQGFNVLFIPASPFTPVQQSRPFPPQSSPPQPAFPSVLSPRLISSMLLPPVPYPQLIALDKTQGGELPASNGQSNIGLIVGAVVGVTGSVVLIFSGWFVYTKYKTR